MTTEDDKLVDTLNAYAERQLAEELGATLAQYTRVVDEKIALQAQLTEVTRERDEIFTRIADLSWEKMSPREQAVWAAAFAILFTWDDDTPKAKDTADEAVLELRKEALK